MSTAAERAKAKYQAVLDNPGRRDSSGMKNRVATTRQPSTGDGGMANRIDRRPSHASQNAKQHDRFRDTVKRWFSGPAY
ncbi:hypothetical protein ACRALDRAFT_1059917 [Sodiomyces alcalophilus JCM 7366]|uniref:uncharacterized protein n=1 Tax=Sodiomyces alcalophilus JCM 7366 TaxID=591952 RepID=UPI0039B40FD6